MAVLWVYPIHTLGQNWYQSGILAKDLATFWFVHEITPQSAAISASFKQNLTFDDCFGKYLATFVFCQKDKRKFEKAALTILRFLSVETKAEGNFLTCVSFLK